LTAWVAKTVGPLPKEVAILREAAFVASRITLLLRRALLLSPFYKEPNLKIGKKSRQHGPSQIIRIHNLS
jgi:hypothetical protein